ncbi:Ankyrin repeat domain-containing protein 65 [Escovopsis weberi]|uniref:Ankyrin repeat domain-containing protein 65 n=1 Tax=Escovopsis weberi TaxID=150374 RepID=A0A0M8N1A1_ESCWE|nr:Ankyrin repeat domain-containing protein 65 [Escovopsis weberi]
MNAIERRRQQNRLAQRKRRNTLKLQLQELEANNRELKAFKDSIVCAGRPGTGLGARFYDGVEAGEGALVLPDPCSYLGTADGEEDYVAAAAGMKSAEVFAGVGGLEMKILQQQQQQHISGGQRIQMQLPAGPTVYGGGGASRSVMDGVSGGTMQMSGSNSSGSTAGSSSGSESISTGTGGSIDTLFRESSSTGTKILREHYHHHHQQQQQQHSGDGRHEAFRLAVSNGHVSMVQLLLRHGAAEINSAGGELGRAPLHDAAAANDAKMVDVLLASGADVCAVDGAGMTALQIAASLGNVDAAERLLGRGKPCLAGR